MASIKVLDRRRKRGEFAYISAVLEQVNTFGNHLQPDQSSGGAHNRVSILMFVFDAMKEVVDSRANGSLG